LHFQRLDFEKVFKNFCHPEPISVPGSHVEFPISKTIINIAEVHPMQIPAKVGFTQIRTPSDGKSSHDPLGQLSKKRNSPG
jgi:hypothetical protein